MSLKTSGWNKTDYKKLILNITTDGSVHPKDALKERPKILIHHFMLFSDERLHLIQKKNRLQRSLMRLPFIFVSC